MLNKQKMFSDLAKEYDFLNNIISFGTHKFVKKYAISKLKIKDNSKILDLCCGTGDLGNIIKKQCPSSEIIGVDFSLEMLKIAKGKNPEIRYFQENACNMSFGDNFFDYIVMGFGLRNIDDKSFAIKEIHRTLKKDGTFLHLDFNKNSVFVDIYDNISMFFVRFFTKNIEPYHYLIKSKRDFYSKEELCLKIEEIGFKQIFCKDVCLGVISIQIFQK